MTAQSSEEGFAHYLLIFAVLIALLLIVSAQIPISRQYLDGRSNVQGAFIADKGSDNSGSSENSNSGDGSGSLGDSHGGPGPSINSGSGRGDAVSSPIQRPPDFRSLPPVAIPRSASISAGEHEVEIKDGRLQINSLNSNGSSHGNQTENEFEQDFHGSPLTIATSSAGLVFTHKDGSVLTRFPLTINPTTNQLEVTTPSGVKDVAILPEDALKSALTANVITAANNQTLQSDGKTINANLQLELNNGVLSYKIDGVKEHKLLGFIPVNTDVTTFISAENGQVTQTDTSLLGRILNRIAP